MRAVRDGARSWTLLDLYELVVDDIAIAVIVFCSRLILVLRQVVEVSV